MLVEVLVVVGVLCIISTLYFLAYVAWAILGLPTDLYLNLWLAFSGFLILAFGAFIFTWAFKVFPPRSVIRSTAHTILWFTGRRTTPVQRGPLVTSGPYAYVRHPIYCGALFIALGLGLLFGFPLIVAGFLAFGFNIVIHFEEKELREVYSDEYEEYRKRVPKLIPWKLARASLTFLSKILVLFLELYRRF